MYQEKTSAQLAEIIRESEELPLEAAKELCTRAGLAWEWEAAEENWKPWVLFHAAALLRVVLRDKPTAILSAKDGPEISIQEAVSDHLWDYTFAAMDDNITNAVHAMVAPCSREEYLKQYLLYCPEDIVYP
jgi:hypothetical protein